MSKTKTRRESRRGDERRRGRRREKGRGRVKEREGERCCLERIINNPRLFRWALRFGGGRGPAGAGAPQGPPILEFFVFVRFLLCLFFFSFFPHWKSQDDRLIHANALYISPSFHSPPPFFVFFSYTLSRSPVKIGDFFILILRTSRRCETPMIFS